MKKLYALFISRTNRELSCTMRAGLSTGIINSRQSLQKVNVTSITQNAEWNRIKWNLSGGGRAQARRIASGTRQRRFDLRESRPRLNGASTRVTFIGRMRATRGTSGAEESCGADDSRVVYITRYYGVTTVTL